MVLSKSRYYNNPSIDLLKDDFSEIVKHVIKILKDCSCSGANNIYVK